MLGYLGMLQVSVDAQVYGNAQVSGDACVASYADICVFAHFGSAGRTTTACRTLDGGIYIVCGCFSGSVSEFREAVMDTHGDTKYGKEYLLLADLIELHLEGAQ
jgi:hypothetical protein